MSTAVEKKPIGAAKAAFLGGVLTALVAVGLAQRFSQSVAESQNLTLIVVGVAFAVGALVGGLLGRSKS